MLTLCSLAVPWVALEGTNSWVATHDELHGNPVSGLVVFVVGSVGALKSLQLMTGTSPPEAMEYGLTLWLLVRRCPCDRGASQPTVVADTRRCSRSFLFPRWSLCSTRARVTS